MRVCQATNSESEGAPECTGEYQRFGEDLPG